METIQTHPSNAAQAKAFTAPGSLSFPTGHSELTPPNDGLNGQQRPGVNGGQAGSQALNGTGVTPATPAATPAATTGGSGLTPTLQYVLSSP